MTLKARVMDPRAADDISDALKDLTFTPRTVDGRVETPEEQVQRRKAPLGYFVNYYPAGLRERAVGPHSRDLVPISRYYPTLKPPVAVDFEPAPPDPWFLEVKQQFFYERGVIYFPIHLTDRLTPQQFTERYQDLARALVSRVSRHDETVVQGVEVEGVLAHPDFVKLIDARARQLADGVADRTGRTLRGAARTHTLKRLKLEVIARLRAQLRHGMDRDECYRQFADETQRPSDGQVRAPVASRSGT